MADQPIATVFGGSGFIGRQIVRRLAAQGYHVRIAVRAPDAADKLRLLGDVVAARHRRDFAEMLRTRILAPAGMPTATGSGRLVVLPSPNSPSSL